VPLSYERDARFAGETHYPFNRMLRLAIDAITGFSIRPLRIASILGLLFGVAGLIGLVYTLAASRTAWGTVIAVTCQSSRI
jgi:dolichol-phosphate mannosyltransferase